MSALLWALRHLCILEILPHKPLEQTAMQRVYRERATRTRRPVFSCLNS